MRARASAILCGSVGLALTLAFAPPLLTSARADVTHIVQRGHTIESIAHRYRVPVKAILEANKQVDPAHLRPGQALVIPGVESNKKKHGAKGAKDAKDAKDRRDERHEGELAARAAGGPGSAEVRVRAEPDTIEATRFGEEFHVRVRDARGHVPARALAAFERLMRQGNATHPVDPRLVALVGVVSGHFGGRTIDVVSGYRAYTPTQYTPHSNHNLGRALDFRIPGVKSEDIRDFCRTLRSAGCGYYPNSSFIHLDVRDSKAYWVDISRPGEPPRYEKPGTPADEGVNEVPDDSVGSAHDTGSQVGGSVTTHPEADAGR